MARIDLKSARTDLTDPAAAAEALVDQLGSSKPKLVTLFASRPLDQTALNQAIRERLPKETQLIGATSAAEIDHEGIHRGTTVLGALEGDFEVGIGLGGGLSTDAMTAGSSAMKQACSVLGTRPQDIDTRSHVGLVIDDGFRYKKEELLLGTLDKNQAIVLVGGGASDTEADPAKQSAELHVNGEVVTDAALVALFRTDAPFAALRHHAYTPTGQSMTITKVSDDGTRALEIDDKPAAQHYADLLGVTVDDLEFGKPKGFAEKPLALKVGREFFLRSPWKPLDDGSILFANLLEEDSTYELMQIGDMAAMTRDFVQKGIAEKVPNPSAVLYFHCNGRQWIADGTGISEDLSEAFKHGPPAVGFNVHFELYCGFSINTTLTTLAFGST